MPNHGLLVCSFFVRKRFSREDGANYKLNHEYEATVDDQDLKFKDIFGMFQSFCENSKEMIDNNKLQKVFLVKNQSVKEYSTETYKAVSFIIRSGSYGVESDMTDRISQQVIHHRSENEADVKEFHCIAFVPKDVGGVTIEKGILVFESIASYGVKTITCKYLREHLAQMGLTLETRSVSVSAFIEKLTKQGKLQRITVIKNHVSPNDADNMLITVGREEKSYINPQVHAEWLNKILRLFDRVDKEGICEIPDDEDFDDISFQFSIDGRMRTVRLRYLDRQSIVEDVPDGVINRDDDTKLINYMIETADAYKDKMVFEGIGEE